MTNPCSYCTTDRANRGLKLNEGCMTLDGPFDGSEPREIRFICAPCAIKVFDAVLRPRVVVGQ